MLYDSIIASQDNFDQWKWSVLNTGIFLTEDEASSYLMKYMVRDYVYLSSTLKSIFSRGVYDLTRLYRFGYEDITSTLNLTTSQMISTTSMDFLLSEPNSYSILIAFPSFKGYVDANTSDLVNPDGTPKYFNEMVYCVARDFVSMPKSRKLEIIDRMIEDILKYCVMDKRRRFSRSLLYYIILKFLVNISSSLDSNTAINITSLDARYSLVLLNELSKFYKLHDIIVNNNTKPSYEMLNNLDETRLSNWFMAISNSEFSNVVQYLQYDSTVNYVSPIPDPVVSDVVIASPTDPNA